MQPYAVPSLLCVVMLGGHADTAIVQIGSSIALPDASFAWPLHAGGLLSGALYQYPGLILMSIVGAGAAQWLVHPAPWLRGVVTGAITH